MDRINASLGSNNSKSHQNFIGYYKPVKTVNLHKPSKSSSGGGFHTQSYETLLRNV